MTHLKKQKKRDKKIVKQEYQDQVDPNLKSCEDNPYFLKKAEQAKELLRKYPPPPGFPPFEG